jgi:AAA family ATP:ADP antiporter
MAFFIGFNYNLLRNMKDALLVTAESSGAEVIPFIKVWGIVPSALIMTFVYSRLNNKLSRQRVFYAMVTIFLLFFTLFTFALYPIRDLLHPHHTADLLELYLPKGFKGLIAMFRYWTFSSFYIMSELWSSFILSTLFWGFANEITKVTEAKRFYGILAVGLNMAAIVAGQTAVFLSSDIIYKVVPLSSDPWHHSIILLTIVILLFSFVIIGIYRYLTTRVLTREDQSHVMAMQKGPKIHMSTRETFAYLAKSKYLMYIAIVVLCYNIVINLVEVVWKDQVDTLYPNPNDFCSYMSQITTITGIISLFACFFISGQSIRKCGWTFTALLSPLVLLITSIIFFTFFFGSSSLVGVTVIMGTSPLALIVLFGSLQNCLARAAKFSLFDATKEIAFIPLSMESKLKGKAVIDGVGSRLGKSGGSLIHQSLIVVFSSIAASAHIVAGLLTLFISAWIVAVVALGKRFNALTVETEEESAPPLPQEKPELAPSR